ncbi:MAG: efflux RND transporter periplasmic adaptor subunit [Dehalococcoidales bacterium]|nr:efflux RND transporter periplasmic adaptor subunit [Dehalococcoidales bacterium]
MKKLKIWQITVLVVVVLGLSGGGFWIYRWATRGSDTGTTTNNTQLVAVQNGTITNTVSSSGNLAYGLTKSLTFGSAGTVGEVIVSAGEKVTAGQALAKLDEASLIPLQKAVVQAQINLETAQTALTDLQSPYTQADITKAEADVLSAKIALTNAQDNLTSAQTPYSESDFLNAQIAVVNAESAITTAQTNYDNAYAKYQSNWTVPAWIYDYEIKSAQLELAKINLTKAQTSLADLKAAPDATQIALKTKQVTVAENNLKTAEDKLAEMKAAADPLQVQLKELDIANARVALEKAQDSLVATTITSPINGVVTTVNVATGDTVNGNTAAIVVIDPANMVISGVLDEVDAPFVKVGQKATVTLDSLSDVAMEGTVTSLGTSGQSNSGIVTYSVKISVTIPEGVQVLAGMSGTADIITEEASNVLVIPDSAIGGTTRNPTVTVSANGVTQVKSITVGISDGSQTEVKSGLQSGEYVVVTLKTKSSSSSSGTTIRTGQFGGFPGSGVINIQGGKPVIIP